MPDRDYSSYWASLGRRRLNRRGVLAAGGAGALTAALAACSNKSSTSSSSSTASSKPAPAAGNVAPANGSPVQGGTFTYFAAANSILDPQKSSAGAQNVVGGVYSRLFRFITGPDPKTFTDHNVENDLGVSVESPDAITWTVKMRPDAKFHNVAPVNGHPVTSEDVKATFQRALDPATPNPNRGTLTMIDVNGITTPDAQTVVFRLNFPYAPFKKTLAAPSYSMIFPREVLTGSYDPATTAIGSGPFILQNYTPDVAYTYKRNPDYFDKPKPYVDTFKIAIVPDANTQQAQFGAGSLDGIIVEDPYALDQIKAQNPKATMLQCPDGRPFPIYLNLSDPSSPFQDVRVRRAVSMAIDRQALGKLIYNGQGQYPLFVPVSMGKWAITVDQVDPSIQQWYKSDPQQAKQLLQAAGQSNLQIRFGYITGVGFSTPPYVKMGETVANMWNQAGVKTQIITQDYQKDYIDAGKGSRQGYFDKDVVIYSGIASYTEADEHLYVNFHSKSTSNDERLSDPKLDAMIDKQRTIVNEDDRLKAIQDIEKYIADQAYVIPTAGSYRYAFLQPRVQNFSYTDSLGVQTETYAKLWVNS